MTHRISGFLLNLSLLTTTAIAGGGGAQPIPSPPAGSVFKKAMVIIFENTNYSDAIRQSFFYQFASQGALMTNFMAETHPSQGNYIALTAGSVYGVRDDGPLALNVNHLVDLIEAQGKTWKVYAEEYPGPCYLGERSGNYVRKHVPFLSYVNIQNNSERCAHIVNAIELDQDIQAQNLPDFSLYIPNLLNDGHDTDVRYADQWFSLAFGTRIQNPNFMKDLLLIATFDESARRAPNQIYTAVIGEHVIPGISINAPFDHYSLLRTIEDGLGLGTLGLNDLTAQPFFGIWR